jgi:hypothetical protein
VFASPISTSRAAAGASCTATRADHEVVGLADGHRLRKKRPMIDKVLARLAVLVSSVVLLLGCAAERGPQVRMDGTEVRALTAAQVAQAVSVTHREGNVIYRAPRLSATREVDLRSGGPVIGANLGAVSLGQSGFLFGVRAHGSKAVRHFAGYQSDFVEGENRFASVTLADGSHPSFRTVPSDRRRCEPDCYLTFEALVIELPDAVLRSAPDAGVPMAITLDNGKRIDVTIPAAYVRGYLQAVDAAGG